MCLIETAALKKFSFEYIVIDEAHRITNVDSILSQIVRTFISRGRLLITGTPLQNNLTELFSLLNFICPEIFVEYMDFKLDSFLDKDSQNSARRNKFIFRFVSEGSVEERMLERAAQKLRLDQLVIQQGRTQAAKGM
jgi:SNF2 family DNA or RNA helicase